MKHFALVVALFLLAGTVPAARAQVVHAATGRGMSISVGGTFSLFEPDYLGGFTKQSSGQSLLYGIDGIGIFADIRYSRWIQFEAETRWLRFNLNPVGVTQPRPVVVREVGENTYLIGPRVRLWRYRGFTPYAKALVGLGTSSLNPVLTTTTAYPAGFKGNTHALVLAFGGGVDYKLTKRINLRLADFELQDWIMHINIPNKQYSPNPMPYGVSAGVSYRIF